RQKIDDVRLRQGRIGGIAGSEAINRTLKTHGEIELLNGGCDRGVDHRFSTRGIDEVDGAALQDVPISAEEEFAIGEIHTTQDDGLGCGSADVEIQTSLQGQFATGEIDPLW